MVRPIELQDNMTKAPLVSRTQYIQQTKPDIAQQQVAKEMAEEHVIDHSRLQRTDESDTPDLRPDQHPDQHPKRRQPLQHRRKTTPGNTEETNATQSEYSAYIDTIA